MSSFRPQIHQPSSIRSEEVKKVSSIRAEESSNTSSTPSIPRNDHGIKRKSSPDGTDDHESKRQQLTRVEGHHKVARAELDRKIIIAVDL